jgi:hypothetical protein
VRVRSPTPARTCFPSTRTRADTVPCAPWRARFRVRPDGRGTARVVREGVSAGVGAIVAGGGRRRGHPHSCTYDAGVWTGTLPAQTLTSGHRTPVSPIEIPRNSRDHRVLLARVSGLEVSYLFSSTSTKLQLRSNFFFFFLHNPEIGRWKNRLEHRARRPRTDLRTRVVHDLA